MKSLKFDIFGMSCATCVSHIERSLKKLDGVEELVVNLLTNSMQIVIDEKKLTVDDIIKNVQNAGYDAKLKDEKKNEIRDDETKKIFKRLIASLIILLPLMYVSMGALMWKWPIPKIMHEYPLSIALYEMILTIIIIIINNKFFKSGFKSIVHLSPNMDSLVALGSGTSFIYSFVLLIIMIINANKGEDVHHLLHNLYFESSAMILTLITVGKTLESFSKGKTTSALKGLMDLSPKTARILIDNKEEIIDIESIKVDDIFLVRPGELVPTDGIIIEGQTSIDESSINGESIPRDKEVNDSVIGGTINQVGFIKCRATRVGKDTTLSQIIALVEDTNASKAPISKIADKVSRIFVPSVILISVITFIIWMIISKDFAKSLNYAICVLVISCPCALGLATPVAIMVGSGIGAKMGILFKSAESLENTGNIDIVVLDKTGTITEGNPKVNKVITYNGFDEEKLFSYISSLERKSEHPIARAIVNYGEDLKLIEKEVSLFKANVGNGVFGIIDDKEIVGGNYHFISKYCDIQSYKEIVDDLSKGGNTPLIFIYDKEVIGIVSIADSLKEDSIEAIEELKKMNIKVVMLTGDNSLSARTIANKVGINYVISDVKPLEKEEVVSELQRYGKVMMVGDGINDAPSLTKSDIGIALNKGNDIAKDASDVVLVKSSLKGVVRAINLSHRVILNIKENLFWAFIYNVICIPIACGMFVSLGISLVPMFGALAMSLSSVFVVSNALRLNICNFHKITFKNRRNIVIDEEMFKERKEEEMMRKEIKIEGMMCMHCVSHVKKALEKMEGIKEVSVSLEDNNAIISYDNVNDEDIIKAIDDAGYTVKSILNVD